MARRELGPASLSVGRAVAASLPAGEAVVGVSGGADSLALALGAKWAAHRSGTQLKCVVIDHQLQAGSDQVAAKTVAKLEERELPAEVVAVAVEEGAADGLEAAARRARLTALSAFGAPVLLGHTLDDQAESVFLGLLRGSGPRSIAGMAHQRWPFIRPLLEIRRETCVQACREWGLYWWNDPHNDDERFARVRARRFLRDLTRQLGRDVAPALARTAALSRVDADFLDELAAKELAQLDLGKSLAVAQIEDLPRPLRLRVLRGWLKHVGLSRHTMEHVLAVAALVDQWRGQGPVSLPGGQVGRSKGKLVAELRSDGGGLG